MRLPGHFSSQFWSRFVAQSVRSDCLARQRSLTVWRNGELAVNETNLATAYNDTHPPYVKMGAYLNKPFKYNSTTKTVQTPWWAARYCKKHKHSAMACDVWVYVSDRLLVIVIVIAGQFKLGGGDSSFDAVSTAHKQKDDELSEQQQLLPIKTDDDSSRPTSDFPPSPAIRTDDAVAAAEPALRAVENVEETIISNDVGLWNDTQGNPLHAHGGGLYTEAGLFYWVGAYTLGPDLPYEDSYSIALYSSPNLGDWELRSSSILNKSAFTNGNHFIHF